MLMLLLRYVLSLFVIIRRPPGSTPTDTLSPYSTLCRSTIDTAAKRPGQTYLIRVQRTALQNGGKGRHDSISRSGPFGRGGGGHVRQDDVAANDRGACAHGAGFRGSGCRARTVRDRVARACRSEEHPSELQSLMRISYAAFRLKNKKKQEG